MEYDKVISPVISGIFAFLGAFVAMRAQRRMARENWLLQRRSEVFSKFLVDFYEYRDEVYLLMDDDYEKRSSLVEKMHTTANLVCLYLPRDARNEFRENFEGYMNFKPNFEGVLDNEKMAEVFAPLRRYDDNIQKLFERILSGE